MAQKRIGVHLSIAAGQPPRTSTTQTRAGARQARRVVGGDRDCETGASFVRHEATKTGDGAFSFEEHDAQMKLVAGERARAARAASSSSSRRSRSPSTSRAANRARDSGCDARPLATAALATRPAPKVEVWSRGRRHGAGPKARSVALHRERPSEHSRSSASLASTHRQGPPRSSGSSLERGRRACSTAGRRRAEALASRSSETLRGRRKGELKVNNHEHLSLASEPLPGNAVLLNWSATRLVTGTIEALSASEGNRVRLADELWNVRWLSPRIVLPPIPRTAHAGGGPLSSVCVGRWETGFE